MSFVFLLFQFRSFMRMRTRRKAAPPHVEIVLRHVDEFVAQRKSFHLIGSLCHVISVIDHVIVT